MQIIATIIRANPVRGGMGGPTWYPLVVSGGNPICSFRQFLAKTYRFARIQNVTDRRQTDRETTCRSKGATDSTVGQKHCRLTETTLTRGKNDTNLLRQSNRAGYRKLVANFTYCRPHICLTACYVNQA